VELSRQEQDRRRREDEVADPRGRSTAAREQLGARQVRLCGALEDVAKAVEQPVGDEHPCR
jgi:hypothetical protein